MSAFTMAATDQCLLDYLRTRQGEQLQALMDMGFVYADGNPRQLTEIVKFFAIQSPSLTCPSLVAYRQEIQAANLAENLNNPNPGAMDIPLAQQYGLQDVQVTSANDNYNQKALFDYILSNTSPAELAAQNLTVAKVAAIIKDPKVNKRALYELMKGSTTSTGIVGGIHALNYMALREALNWEAVKEMWNADKYHRYGVPLAYWVQPGSFEYYLIGPQNPYYEGRFNSMSQALAGPWKSVYPNYSPETLWPGSINQPQSEIDYYANAPGQTYVPPGAADLEPPTDVTPPSTNTPPAQQTPTTTTPPPVITPPVGSNQPCMVNVNGALYPCAPGPTSPNLPPVNNPQGLPPATTTPPASDKLFGMPKSVVLLGGAAAALFMMGKVK